MANTFLTNDQARAWINQNGIYNNAGTYDYFACVSLDGLSQDFGDQTRVECPDPDQYGQFILLGTYSGEITQLTTSMTGRFSGTEISTLYKLAKAGCDFDVQVFTGRCQQPTDRKDFDKVLVLQGVNVTSWSTDPLIALQSGDRAVINETVDLSVKEFFEIVNLIYSLTGEGETAVLLDEIVSIEYNDSPNCGDCDDSDGCQTVFAASLLGYGFYSTDGGATWTTAQMTATGPANPAGNIVDAMVYGDSYIAIDATGAFWTVNIDDWLETPATTWGTVASGIAGTATALASYGTFGLMTETGGVINQFIDNDTDFIEVYDGASIASANLNAVDTLGEKISVAVGDNAIVYSNNGTVWIALTTLPAFVGTGVMTSVLVRSVNTWLVGTDDGELWSTDDSGRTWTRVAYPGWLAPTNGINDLEASNGHVLWMAQDDRLLRSIDGGHKWIVEPNSRTNSFVVSKASAIAACKFDPNVVLLGGIHDTDTTAAIVIGSVGL